MTIPQQPVGAKTVRYSPVPPVNLALDNPTLFHLQGKRCFLCGHKMKRGLTREHVWPKVSGGREAGNVLLAHLFCNAKKADRMPSACELLYRDAIYMIASTRVEAASAAANKKDGK